MTLSYISKTIWCMSVIFSDNETVWPKLWPQSKCKSTWLIFHGLVILFNIFKIIWWMNITVGIMDQCIWWSSDFASYRADYLMEKNCTWDNGSPDSERPCKYMWVTDLYLMVHWFYLISLSDLDYFYGKEMAPAGDIRAPLGTYSRSCFWTSIFMRTIQASV